MIIPPKFLAVFSNREKTRRLSLSQPFDDVAAAICFLVELNWAGVAVLVLLRRDHWRDAQIKQKLVDPIRPVSLVAAQRERPAAIRANRSMVSLSTHCSRPTPRPSATSSNCSLRSASGWPRARRRTRWLKHQIKSYDYLILFVFLVPLRGNSYLRFRYSLLFKKLFVSHKYVAICVAE